MSNQKKYKICLALLIVAITGAIIPIIINRSRQQVQVAKDPTVMEAKEIRTYFESQEFSRLPIAEKAKFFEAIPEKQRREIMRPQRPKEGEKPQRPNFKAMQQMRKIREYQMEQRLNKFFSASQAEQNRMLDEDIARMKQMRSEMAQRRAEREKRNNNNNSTVGGNNNSQQNRPQRPQMDEQSKRDRDASMNPATRAKMRIYFEKLRQREQQTKK